MIPGIVAGGMRSGGGGGPVDPYYANVSLLLNMQGPDGSTVFTDESPAPKPISVFGNTQINGNSGLFDGNGDYLTTPGSTAFDFGAGDGTIEFYFRPSTSNPSTMLTYSTGNVISGTDVAWHFWHLASAVPSKLQFNYFSGNTQITVRGTVDLVTDTEYHCALTKEGDAYRLFIDGVLDTTVTSSAPINTPGSSRLFIGRYPQSGGFLEMAGRMRGLRISKGVARYTADFTPPTIPLPTS